MLGCRGWFLPSAALVIAAWLAVSATPGRAANLVARPASTPPLVTGLDHIPIAVADLERAEADFARLGFAIKPGRAHPDGVRNAHVKFPDGTELELITASRATDDLTSDYVAFLRGGDGPAFWGLYSPDQSALAARLSKMGLNPEMEDGVVSLPRAALPHRLFFAGRQRSPTDRPEHFAHRNTAYRLSAVWLSGAPEERRLVEALGAAPDTPACAPFAPRADRLRLPEGEVVYLPAQVGRPSEREIVAATVEVRDLDAARRLLKANHVKVAPAPGCGQASLWIAPQNAHGLWLELHS